MDASFSKPAFLGVIDLTLEIRSLNFIVANVSLNMYFHVDKARTRYSFSLLDWEEHTS